MAVNIAQEDHIYLYPDLESCRRQVRGAGLDIVHEWISPHTAVVPPADLAGREYNFRRGNYICDAIRSPG
jgi:hypothetical protein